MSHFGATAQTVAGAVAIGLLKFLVRLVLGCTVPPLAIICFLDFEERQSRKRPRAVRAMRRLFRVAAQSVTDFRAGVGRAADRALFQVMEGDVNEAVSLLLRLPETECPICAETRFWHAMLRLQGCGDVMCRHCARSYVEAGLDAGRKEFACPFDADHAVMSDRDVRLAGRFDAAYVLRVESMYVREGLAEMVDCFKCPTSTCVSAVFSERPLEEEAFVVGKSRLLRNKVFDMSVDGVDLRRYKCVGCSYSYCVLCGIVWHQADVTHEGVSCARYQRRLRREGLAGEPDQDGRLNEMLISRERSAGLVKRCPNCRVHVQRNGGADHMTCTNCRTHFCWRCQRRYPQECTLNCNGGTGDNCIIA